MRTWDRVRGAGPILARQAGPLLAAGQQVRYHRSMKNGTRLVLSMVAVLVLVAASVAWLVSHALGRMSG